MTTTTSLRAMTVVDFDGTPATVLRVTTPAGMPSSSVSLRFVEDRCLRTTANIFDNAREWTPLTEYVPCADCAVPVPPLEVFPANRCLGCHANHVGDWQWTADEIVAAFRI